MWQRKPVQVAWKAKKGAFGIPITSSRACFDDLTSSNKLFLVDRRLVQAAVLWIHTNEVRVCLANMGVQNILSPSTFLKLYLFPPVLHLRRHLTLRDLVRWNRHCFSESSLLSSLSSCLHTMLVSLGLHNRTLQTEWPKQQTFIFRISVG